MKKYNSYFKEGDGDLLSDSQKRILAYLQKKPTLSNVGNWPHMEFIFGFSEKVGSSDLNFLKDNEYIKEEGSWYKYSVTPKGKKVKIVGMNELDEMSSISEQITKKAKEIDGLIDDMINIGSGFSYKGRQGKGSIVGDIKGNFRYSFRNLFFGSSDPSSLDSLKYKISKLIFK